MYTTALLACLCFGLTLLRVVSAGCPPVAELIGCSGPDVCPEDRPIKLYSYIPASASTGGHTCPACSFCVSSADECPSLPCPMFRPPPGCNIRLYPVKINVGGSECPWSCHVITC